MNKILKMDKIRYAKRISLPKFQKYYRKIQSDRIFVLKCFHKLLFNYYKKKRLIELSEMTQIGEGLYMGHAYCITINPNVVIGKNCNIHKGVTIGQENRGVRKGCPKIGNEVWIGVNTSIVGNIKIGNDVLIAPNTFVNCDIPSHSIVIGNPCIIKHCDHATKGYINRKVD